MGESIVVTSGKGGVGKTSACLNIGVALSLLGKRVLLADMDIGLRNLDVIMGVEDKIVFDIVDVVEGRCRLKQALVQDPRYSGRLHLLPAAQTRDKRALTAEDVRPLFRDLSQQYDYVLLDSPAGIEQGFRNAVAGAEQAIVVTMPDVSAVRDADRVLGLLLAYDIPSPKLLINRAQPRLIRKGDSMSVRDTVDVLGAPLLGVIPDDEAVLRAGNLGVPVALGTSRAAQAYRNIASRILGQEVPLLVSDRPRAGALARLFGA